jgi:pimeloyl-ACP methyl ester carboxylesterase
MRTPFSTPSYIIIVGTLIILSAACSGESPEETGTVEVVSGTATTVSFDGVPIAYESVGTGTPTLVFVHGWSCDRGYWDAQVGPFSDRFRVVTLDLAGHGESGLERDAWTIASYGVDVAAVVEHLDLDRVILVGHSMGGDVVVTAARLLSGKVAGLVWVDTYGRLGTARTSEDVTDFLAPFRVNFVDSTYAFVRRALFSPTADPALAEQVARDMAAAPSHVALPSLESSITNDRVVPAVLDKLDLPVVSLNPESSLPDVESLERYGVEVILVPDVGHFMMMDNPDAFNAILMEVVEGMLE